MWCSKGLTGQRVSGFPSKSRNSSERVSTREASGLKVADEQPTATAAHRAHRPLSRADLPSPNGLRLSGARMRVRCSRGLGACFFIEAYVLHKAAVELELCILSS